MAKRKMFDVLTEMHNEDCENKSRLIGVSLQLLEASTAENHSRITMAGEVESAVEIGSDNILPILLLVDKKEFYKRRNCGKESEQK